MKNAGSLRVKLVLSYLGVTLGAILLLVVVVTFAVQNYFYTSQRDQLKASAEVLAQQVGVYYQRGNDNWDNVSELRIYGPDLFIVVDNQQQVRSEPPPRFIKISSNDAPALRQALLSALKGNESQGTLQGSSDDPSMFSGQYVSMPIQNQANNQIIGAILLAEPAQYPRGFSPYEFLGKVDQAILIAGACIAIIVIIFSLFLTRRLTQPLVLLTAAAEQMTLGNYTERVTPPRTKDELGRLALTFNSMADKIEADVNELKHQEQTRRDMVANIAHDLVTPLTAIQGLSEALADDVISETKARQETAQLIGREVQRLRRLVSDMQQMSSLEAGKVQLDQAPLDLHALVDETLAVIGPECEQASIALHNEIAPTTPLVQADSDRITQVLLNLLDNARRHTPQGGSITIRATVAQPWLIVRVSDTGSGISPADLPYIFERFYRVDRSRTGSSGGSGLGLSIVKAIVTAHGGSIHAESTPGNGTTIVFTLPLARPSSSREIAPPSLSTPAASHEVSLSPSPPAHADDVTSPAQDTTSVL